MGKRSKWKDGFEIVGTEILLSGCQLVKASYF